MPLNRIITYEVLILTNLNQKPMKSLRALIAILFSIMLAMIWIPADIVNAAPIDNGISIEYVLPGNTVTSTSIIDVGVEKPYTNYNIIFKTDTDLTNLYKWDHRIGPGLPQEINNANLYQIYKGFHLGSVNKLLKPKASTKQVVKC